VASRRATNGPQIVRFRTSVTRRLHNVALPALALLSALSKSSLGVADGSVREAKPGAVAPSARPLAVASGRIDRRDDAESVFERFGRVEAEIFAVAGSDELYAPGQPVRDPDGHGDGRQT
jgi:hypothetical protein